MPRIGIPDLPAATGVATGDMRRQIILALAGAFTVHYLSRITFSDSSIKPGETSPTPGQPDFSKANRESNLAAWLVILVILSIASDIETTRELAVAFAFLLMLVAFLGEGTMAFGNVQKLQAAYTAKQQGLFDRKEAAKGKV